MLNTTDMKQRLNELIDNALYNLNQFHDGLSNIIFENQEGQEEHFDKLSKSEQIALYSMFVATKTLLDAIYSYKSWFK